MRVAACCAFAALVLAGGAAAVVPVAPGPPVAVRAFVTTGTRLGEVVRWGPSFAYVEETTGRLQVSALDGSGLRDLATLPGVVEEYRCDTPAPGHGWDDAALYCHSPDNRIYRIGTDGTVETIATLPEKGRSDGAMAFDKVGRFGWALLALTGRSGPKIRGGAVYAVSPGGTVERLFSYPGPGGAENALVAPAGFGRQAGELLVTVDAQTAGGRLLALDPRGRSTELMRTTGDGLNSLALVPEDATGPPAAGVYLSETLTRRVYLVPAAALAAFRPAVLVAAEQRGWVYVVRPGPRGPRAVRLRTTLSLPKYNFEGATSSAG